MRKTLTALATTVVFLLGVGVIVLASASAVRAQGLYGDPHFFVKRQLIWLGLAVGLVFAVSRFDYHWWREIPEFTVGFYVLVLIALALVFVPGIGVKVNGSYRWLKFGPIRVQPSEFAKLLAVIAMGGWFDRIGWRAKQFWKGAVWPGIGLAAVAALIIIESDFGATLVVMFVGGTLMFVSGTRLWYLLAFGVAALGPAAAMIAANPNRMERLLAWWAKRSGGTTTSPAAYHVEQALVAFKNGGPWGVGFNQSIQKYNYLPEAHTDFIFAIGGEEFGFSFSIIILLAFMVILVCGMLISMRAPDRLGRLLAFGMTLLLVFQAVFNIGVVTDCLPTKGLALPFISYGGTNLVAALFAVGTLFNVGRHIDVFDERMHTQVVKNAAIKV
ncbi:MAG: putative peptidoglycan glycosyltransferase FtsW [Kiritimatiellae bacterium]|nr:putative peptidoglycan glycosyltransferase FtsW [Kiritimatiellia bacterium]MDD4621761.1 putative peptidoglycan glycosyltransferase FtsW [Kiritimatiellia bacterium]